MIRSAHLCDTCDQPTSNGANYIGDFQCDDCAERSYDNWVENYYSGAGPVTLREQQIAARRLK